MDLLRFAHSPAGRLVRVGWGAAAYWAFMPHPLPPTLDLEPLQPRLDVATAALADLAALAAALPDPARLTRPFLRREALYSCRIEGNRLDGPKLLAREFAPSAYADPDLVEVLNYVHALHYGLERLATLPLSVRLLRELHARLLKGVRGQEQTPGEFRRSQNWIGPPGCTLNTAAYVPPPAPEMWEALGGLEHYLHHDDMLPRLVRLGCIHYQFEAIHPFLDGNGRLGRLLMALLLVHWGVLPAPLLTLSAYFEQNRPRYYAALYEVSAGGAWQDWLAFFLDGVTDQARDAQARAERLLEAEQRYGPLWPQAHVAPAPDALAALAAVVG
jgi:Fic family protein